ncbi:cobalamin-binding protein [Oceanospirillum linum]|nr:cobalamin-binding protein [Oceanospirillum linum]SEF44262.1 iron complex transport system substrate-binding protein [Oleiphilus messinensis]SMP01535.1 iron complex transport system substrate-binding protein [Oceanospirillum linum]
MNTSAPLLQPRNLGSGYLVKIFVFFLLGCSIAMSAHAGGIELQDDLNNKVVLPQPAQRIVSLAPSVTELLFSAGAGSKVVAAVDYSDFPEEAKTLPRVGGYTQLDIERILALRPDVVIGWKSGNHPAALEQLRKLNIPVYITETRFLDQIPTTLERFGLMAGTQAQAQQEAEHFRNTLHRLKTQYQHKTPVRVFYQVWNQPLITINRQNLINQVIEACGGQNVFAELNTIAPRIDVEAVLKANPDAIVASGMGIERPEWLDEWLKWPAIKAVKNHQLHFIPPGHIQRQTVRVLLGTERLCQQLEQTRHTMDGQP